MKYWIWNYTCNFVAMSLKWKIAQAAEVKWWQNYLKKKDKDAYYQWKRAYWQSFLSDIEVELPTSSVQIMDAGCGPAGIFTILQDHQVVAVDPLLESYKKEITQFDISDYEHVRFVDAPIEDFLEPASYDIIFCLNCINHVSSIPDALSNLYQSLKPEGRLIISTDAHHYSFLKVIFQWLPGDILHPHQYDIDEYRSFLKEAGFDIDKSQEVKSERIFGYWVIQANRPK